MGFRIETEREYEHTRVWADKFRASIAEAEREGPPAGVSAEAHALVVGGVRHQLAQLEAQLRECEEQSAR